MKSGRFHFPSSNNGSELQDPAALDNGSADAGNRFRPSEFPCGSTGTGEIAETGNAVQCSGLLGKGEQVGVRAASASNDLLKHHFHDTANHWRKLAEQADRHAYQDTLAIRSREIAAA